MKYLKPLFFLLIVAAFPAGTVSAQSTPFLSDGEIRMLTNELSGDRAFEHIRWLSHWHRNSGMEGYFKAVEYVMQAAQQAGLEDVRFIEQPLPGPAYTAKSAELWMLEPVEVKLADIGDHALYLADGSADADVTAELVWIDDASEAALEGRDLEGKIVLTRANPSTAVYRAVWGKGALGVVAYPVSEGKSMLDFPDQIAWTRIPMAPEGKRPAFAFTLPPRKGELLRKILMTEKMQDYFATGKRTPGGRIVVHARVDTEINRNEPKTGFIEGWIRGSRYHDQQIVLTAHLQEEQGSANDDGSGSANLLEIARTFSKLIREGKMERPLRDLRFWWTDEIYSEYRFFRDHPEEPKKFLVNLHQDMTGARQSYGSRVQHLIHAPHSITSYLDALLLSIGTYVIQTNNAFLSASRAGGLPRPFTRPIYSTRGSREGFNAAFVPYFGQSDYMCFVEGAIGVPAVALINWDDPYIHSSDDDLDKIDQTQLARNSFIIAGMAKFLARARAEDVPLIAQETLTAGLARLAREQRIAMDLIRRHGKDGWTDASLLLEQGAEREQRALRSVAVFAGKDKKARKVIDTLAGELKRHVAVQRSTLERFFYNIVGKKARAQAATAAEKQAMRKIPVNATPLETYFSKRGSVPWQPGLHGIMRAEVFNFVDGTRSYYDIYKAVRAEALSAGAWYYGTVSLENVTAVLDAAVEAGALLLK